MNKRGGKKGQFFIIAALILSVVILGFAAVTNYALTEPEPVQFFDLADELGVESTSIINYGVANQQDIGSMIENFGAAYAVYAGKDTTLILVYGNREEIKIMNYAPKDTGTISLQLGETRTVIPITIQANEIETIPNPESPIIVVAAGKEYSFELKEGENFYFVLSREGEGGTYVSNR